MFNCTKSYLENELNFSKPMPWIGLYIAAASLCCPILIITELLASYRRRSRIWIPPGYFTLNASSLTVLAVATKLSVDLNTAMPRRTDQLAKLGASVLICVSIAHFIPTLGRMGNTDMITNLIALVILIITSFVNLCIQLNTGVIYAFIKGHIFLLASMIYLLMVCCCTAIALASIKNELRVMYDCKQKLAMDELRNGNRAKMTNKRLQEYLVKFTIMSHTGWPLLVVARSILFRTSTLICFVDTVIFYFLTMYTYCLPKFHLSLFVDQFEHGIFCDNESDYEWSSSLVFAAQIFAAMVGFIVLFVRQINIPRTEKMRLLPAIRNLIKIERHWTQLLIELRQRPLFFHIRDKRCRKYVHQAKYCLCNFLIAIQSPMVLTIKVIGFVYDISLSYLFCFLQRKFYPSFYRNLNLHSTSLSITNPSEFKQYVLYLKGEEDIIESMLTDSLYSTREYIEEGKREEPAYLLYFLKNSHSLGFPGVFLFDSSKVPHFDFDFKEPPSNCWSLSVVTLTSLAVLLPDIDPYKVNKLLKAVTEGLTIVKKVEENLNDNIHLKNRMKAADIVWEELDIHGKRLDVDFQELTSKGNNPINILRFLADSAKNNFQASGPSKENTSIWPTEAVASYCLYRVCETILLDFQPESSQFETNDNLFEMLSSRLCDILGACLTNLKNSILKECFGSTIENMSETAKDVLILFGRSEKIMELLDGREVPHLNSDQLAFIDEWRRSSETC